jgi:hypothetical protein
MVLVVSPGYAERRKVLEVERRRGRELGFRISQSLEEEQVPGEAEALWELRGRMVHLFRNTRMTTSEILRFGSLRLCDVPKLNVLAGAVTTVVLNGVTVLREVSLCSWRMDQVELLEFCSRGACPNPDAPAPLRYPDTLGRRKPGGAIVIREKR